MRLVIDTRDLAVVVSDLPHVAISPDPYDNYLLATALAGSADFLVTSDKRDLLSLERVAATRIISVRAFLELHRRLP